MASPFPGMDPFLEDPAYWPDFHSTFINYWREAIAEALPSGYEASLGERVYLIEHDPEARKLGFPDVAVTQGPRESYIEILHQPERTLVAVLELLSPANKEQPGRIQYLEKRQALLYQKVHLVELDLLLAGRRMPFMKPLPPADYYYTVARGDQRPDSQVYFWNMPQPLPRLPVPLRTPDPDILIDLAAVFTTAYDRGRFRRRLNYRGRIAANLVEERKQWVEGVVRAGG